MIPFLHVQQGALVLFDKYKFKTYASWVVEVQDWSQDISGNWSMSVSLFCVSFTTKWFCFS